MDFEQASIRLPTLKEFNNKIKQIIDEKVKKSRMELIESIAKGENMSLDYLKTKYGARELRSLVNPGTKGSEGKCVPLPQ